MFIIDFEFNIYLFTNKIHILKFCATGHARFLLSNEGLKLRFEPSLEIFAKMAKHNDEIFGDFLHLFLFICALDYGVHMGDQIADNCLDNGGADKVHFPSLGNLAKEVGNILAIIILGGEFAKSVIIDVGIDVNDVLHRQQVLIDGLLDQIAEIEFGVDFDQYGGVNLGKQFVGNTNAKKGVENGGHFIGELDVVTEIDEIEDLRNLLNKHGNLGFEIRRVDLVELGTNLVDKYLRVVQLGENGGFECGSLPFVLFRLGLFENPGGSLNLSRFLHVAARRRRRRRRRRCCWSGYTKLVDVSIYSVWSIANRREQGV